MPRRLATRMQEPVAHAVEQLPEAAREHEQHDQQHPAGEQRAEVAEAR